MSRHPLLVTPSNHRVLRASRTRIVALVLSLLALMLVGGTGGARAQSDQVARPAAAEPGGVVEIPVSFEVRNVNRSEVACPSDGETYTVRGHLTGPQRLLGAKRVPATTLYLHGLGFGEFLWRFQGSRGHDYAGQQARRNGQVSVTIDRLGYGSSDKPDGNQICVGSRADIAHQIVRDLKSGDYRSDQTSKRQTPRFSKVALAGHSYGGQIAELAAYSFGDIDGLFLLGYADRVQSDLLEQNAAYAAQVCASGGLDVAAGGPGHYAPFGPPTGAPGALFNSARGAIERAALRNLTIDPCGDSASFDAATAANLQHADEIDVPVLVVGGGADLLFPRPAARHQAELFTGSRRVTHRTLSGTAHAYTFERSEDRLVDVVDRWLRRDVLRAR